MVSFEIINKSKDKVMYKYFPEDEEWYHYADHAIQKVQENIKNNIIPEYGESWWY